jgi:thiamine-phosphate pyrophosphorylase
MTAFLDLRVYAVLDPTRCRGRDPVQLVGAAARGGATLVQLRHKQVTAAEFLALTRQVQAVLRPFNIPLLVNDRVDIALEVGVEGAHVGQSDLAAAEARRLLGADAILGVTVHHAPEAAALEPGLATYLGLGPVFATASKDEPDPPLGPDGLRRLSGAVRQHHPGMPVCAIAGIDWSNAAKIIEAGADGVAVISDIFMADDVEGATRRLRAVVDQALARPARAGSLGSAP